jgi:hypothetical protein
METYHKFAEGELAGLSRAELIKALTGKVMTCSRCCGDRIVITTSSQETMDGIAVYYGVTCGGYTQMGKTGCHHNIYSVTLEDAINRWNAEIDKELSKGDPVDLATEIKVI